MNIKGQKYKSINLNSKVRVKLGEKGFRQITKRQFESYLVDADGALEMPLYELMNIFGEITTIGSGEEVFQNTEIIIPIEELNDVSGDYSEYIFKKMCEGRN